ncbi:BRCA1 protein, partial [Alcedo cyanopectus]|nr:BRCA1 protein [Ceyx cyanopectus]
FPRFCMLQLLSKKKKDVIQCPLCKAEVTKRNLKENLRFKQLTEGLLETIKAFELDTGLKFLNSHHFAKTSPEATAAEVPCKESSVIQSKGFRKRKMFSEENGQENCTLEASLATQLTNTRVRRYPLRNKPQKHDSEKGVYIEIEHTEALEISSQEKQEELKSAEKEESSCNTQPDMLGAEGESLPQVPGESDFSKEVPSKRTTLSITEYTKPGHVNVTEYQSFPLGVLDVDPLTEQSGRSGSASPSREGHTPFCKNTEMDSEQSQHSTESKELDLKDHSESRLDRAKEMDDAHSAEAVEMFPPENDSCPDKELPQEKLPQPETPHSGALNRVSRKRLKRSIQKVHEWFSKSNEILSSSSSQDDSTGAADVSGEGDTCLSDKDSCVSEKTDPMVDPMHTTGVEGNKRLSKEAADSLKDKIFGKTYRRERKSNLPVVSKGFLPTTQPKAELDNSIRNRLKRKRKSACVLQPEDFIKKKVLEVADECPQSVNQGLGDAERKRCDESHLSENRESDALTALEEGGGSTTEKVTGKHCGGKLEQDNCDQKSTRRGSAAKRCKHSTRTRCALQLVDRDSVPPEPAEPQIESYPSSGEPRAAADEEPRPRQVRRSRRLQLLTEEVPVEPGQAAGTRGARAYSRDRESVPGLQRKVLVHTSECKRLCEPQGTLGNRLLAGLEASEKQSGLKNSPEPAETGKSLPSPTSLCQHSACGSPVPDASPRKAENPFHPQSPSTAAVQPASHPAEEVTGASAAVPQGSGHDTQSVPGALRADTGPVAEKAPDVITEAEDSELDTQDLRNVFRHSKRLSFTLCPAPTRTSAEDAASEPSKVSGADGAENKHSKRLKEGHLQEEKTTAGSLSRAREMGQLRGCEAARGGPVGGSASSTEDTHREEPQQAANQEGLTPRKTGPARTKDKSRGQKGEQGSEKEVSPDTGRKRELRQNPRQRDRSPSDQSNAEEPVVQRTDSNTLELSHPAGKGSVAGSKAPELPLQYRSVICPAACEQRPSEARCEVTGKKRSKRARKQAKGDEEQAAQTASTGVPESSVTKALADPLKGNSDCTGLSETPDVLLCSEGDAEENTSFAETDRRERSAVFVKSDLVKELHNSQGSSTPRYQGIQRPRRKAHKLQSSDEESSEEEDLPCFQALIFGKSESTPLQSSKQVTSVVESSVSPITLPHKTSHDDNDRQKMPEAALNNDCASPSQDSECSVNLFSSQSNLSEDSVDGAEELKKPEIPDHTSQQESNVKESKETSRSCNGRLKRSKTTLMEEWQDDPNVGAILGEASGSDSDTSYVEDSCEPFSQGEILTTQQKNVMQNNLKKLQQEMAALEAVLKQHGSPDCEVLPMQRELPHFISEGTLGVEQRRQERENTDEQKSGRRLNSTSVLSSLSGNVTRSPKNSSSSVRLLSPQSAEAANGSGTAQNADQSPAQEQKPKRSGCFPIPVLHDTAGKENTASPAVTSRKAMSLVASGLNHSEHLVVQKFARKTQSTLSNHITEGTTHVIMKTDKELVCERTLKYFLGIAGGKWVVSYQWVIQSFKEGRILDEEKFEVRGDVINGRNHQGPRRARESLTEKIFKDFEICCYGPFTDMTTEHLEWMVELCGASVVKQLHLFTHPANSTAVVVVQPDAWMENVDYRALQQKSNVAMVTREWVLDSVACYECQEFTAYLLS